MFNEIEDMKSSGDVERLFALLQNNKDNSEKGWMTRLDAAEALAQLGDPRGWDYLRRMAKSPDQDIREVALEILDGLKEDPPESAAQATYSFQPGSDSLFFKINARYPYVVAWAAFVVLYLIAAVFLNPVINILLTATQSLLPDWLTSLFIYLLYIAAGFFVFRFIVKIFVLPYINKS